MKEVMLLLFMRGGSPIQLRLNSVQAKLIQRNWHSRDFAIAGREHVYAGTTTDGAEYAVDLKEVAGVILKEIPPEVLAGQTNVPHLFPQRGSGLN